MNEVIMFEDKKDNCRTRYKREIIEIIKKTENIIVLKKVHDIVSYLYGRV